MKDCQIFIYGGRYKWLDVAHRKKPETNWYIIIGTPHKQEVPNHFESIQEKIDLLEAQQKDYPESERIHYIYLEIDFENDLTNLIRFFRALINYLTDKEYKISCNLTSGIFEMQIALYLAAQIESSKITEVFYINKQTFDKNLLFKTIKLTKKAKILLNIVYQQQIGHKENTEIAEISLTELHALCVKNNLNMDLPALSRTVKKLIFEGYIVENRKGRQKLLSVSELGMIFCPISDYYKLIQEKIKI